MLTRRALFSGSWIRLLHQSSSSPVSTKTNLAKLRKKTGFSFANCKKALQKFDNDLTKAENWLKEEAQKEGWSKATKLKGRATSDGLIGITYQDHQATMIEVNCETDFVARNVKFHNFVGQVTLAAFKHLQNTASSADKVIKQHLTSDELKNIQCDDGKTLEDLMALSIGQVGENMILNRAVNFTVPEDHIIGTYVHSSVSPAGTQYHLGKYGAVTVFQRTGKSPTGLKLPELGRRLGQHIVGMSPVRIGEYTPLSPEEREANRLKAEKLQAERLERGKLEAESGYVDGESLPAEEEHEEEAVVEDMVHQEYLFDPAITVGEMLLTENVKVIDFERYACGEVEQDS